VIEPLGGQAVSELGTAGAYRNRHTSCGQPQPTRSFPPPAALPLVGHFHEGETAEVLLCLDVGAVGEQGRAARRLDAEHGGLVIPAAGEDEDPGGLHLCHHCAGSLGRLAEILVREVGYR
jgi:hypothetical protein